MSEAAPVRERVAELFLRRLHRDIPAFDTDLFDSGVLDSMAFVELLVCLEEEFGVRVPFDSIEPDAFRSIDRIAGFVERSLPRPMATGSR